MSSTWQAGSTASFNVALVDLDGTAVAATGGSWTVNDADGNELATGSLTVAGQRGSFTVPAEATAMRAVGSSAEGREIVLVLTTAGGDVTLYEYATTVARQALVRFRNTILSYPDALALRHDFGPVLNAWDSADDRQRMRALIHAFANMSRIAYSVRPLAEGVRDRDYAAYGTGDDEVFDLRRKVSLTTLSQGVFDGLPDRFKTASRRAQLIEADVLLGGDVVSKNREDGIISETIGESSTFFNSKPFLTLPISRRAYEVMKPFIAIKVSIGR